MPPLRTYRRQLIWSAWALAAIGILGAAIGPAWACPFCSAVSQTLCEEIAAADVAVLAKLTQVPPKAKQAAQTGTFDAERAKFEVVDILKGEKVLGTSRTIETVYFGDNPVGTLFLLTGIDPASINWSTPIAITPRGREYITKALTLPKEGADRLAYFQQFLEDKQEDMLARDAYDEFAKAPYKSVRELSDRMNHDQLVKWVQDPQIPLSRRGLYLTMLGACGTKDDLPLLEELMKSSDRQKKGALNALVAAYLTIKGSDGMPLIEDLFLKDKEAEYTDTYAAIMALRFHGQEESAVPRARLLEGLRHMLDRPQLADLVIPDLARWEDWSAMDRLVQLFKTSDEETSWVRLPVVQYLQACPQPKAKEYLAELEKIDPETVKRASSFFAFPGKGAAQPATGAQQGDAKQGDKKPAAEGTSPPPAADNKTATEKLDKASSGGPPKASAAVLTDTRPAESATIRHTSAKPLNTAAGATRPAGNSKSAASTRTRSEAMRRGESVLGEIAAAARPRHVGGDAAPNTAIRGWQLGLGILGVTVVLFGVFWVILFGDQTSTAKTAR